MIAGAGASGLECSRVIEYLQILLVMLLGDLNAENKRLSTLTKFSNERLTLEAEYSSSELIKTDCMNELK